jgi:hypothetical protein
MSAPSPADEARYPILMDGVWQNLQAAKTPAERRTSFIVALNAIRERDLADGHISAARAWHQLLDDLLAVHGGEHIAALEPDPKLARRVTPRWQQQLMGVALLTIDALKEVGDSEREAIGKVLRVIRRRVPDADETRVRNWMAEAHRGGTRLPEGTLRRYREGQLPDHVAAMSPADRAEWFLGQLRDAPALKPLFS